MMDASDPTALLGTEFRIIAEDKKHVVIAIRVEKETLRRNAPFLWAMLTTAPEPRDEMVN
ncbi:hypothetical protein [Afipia birgiae]|jgi:hypothetical protein|uniref:hypothetical protein n=1 Tax=Afipia birgiae TaxID=151414 RepID=UPI00030C29FC|nr:hypothetical protein [Afipia birgiae]MBX9820053.1 hypothetical protein [Afipia birgiae]